MNRGSILRTLLDALAEDQWRKAHPFTAEITEASKLLLHPYAYDDEREQAMNHWLQANQPCLFGRIAAASSRIYHCFVTEPELRQSDSVVKEKIKFHLKTWK